MELVDTQLAVLHRSMRRQLVRDSVGTTTLAVRDDIHGSGSQLSGVLASLAGVWSLVVVVRALDGRVVRARKVRLLDGDGRRALSAR